MDPPPGGATGPTETATQGTVETRKGEGGEVSGRDREREKETGIATTGIGGSAGRGLGTEEARIGTGTLAATVATRRGQEEEKETGIETGAALREREGETIGTQGIGAEVEVGTGVRAGVGVGVAKGGGVNPSRLGERITGMITEQKRADAAEERAQVDEKSAAMRGATVRLGERSVTE